VRVKKTIFVAIFFTLGPLKASQAQDVYFTHFVRDCSQIISANVDNAAKFTTPQNLDFKVYKNETGKYAFKSSNRYFNLWCTNLKFNCDQSESDTEITTWWQARRTQDGDMFERRIVTRYDKATKIMRVQRYRMVFTSELQADVTLQCD
jgi:hypothetical protein